MHGFQKSSACVLATILAIPCLISCAPAPHFEGSPQGNFTDFGKVAPKHDPARSKNTTPNLLEPEEGFAEKLKDFEYKVTKIIEGLPRSARFLISEFSAELINLDGERTSPEGQKAQELLQNKYEIKSKAI